MGADARGPRVTVRVVTNRDPNWPRDVPPLRWWVTPTFFLVKDRKVVGEIKGYHSMTWWHEFILAEADKKP